MAKTLADTDTSPRMSPTPPRWSAAERWRRLGAEAVGVFAIVFAAVGATAASHQANSPLPLVGAALASGLTVMAMIYAAGHISGAHFNPAVTLAFTVARHFPVREAPGYVAAQLAGGSLAALTLKLLFGDGVSLGVTAPAQQPLQALGMEMIITFFLMYVITSVATDTRAVGQSAAIAIGVTVMVGILIAGPVSGGSMNPARSFAPALIAWAWRDQWVYWLGPAVGATLGALTYQALRGNTSPTGA